MTDIQSVEINSEEPITVINTENKQAQLHISANDQGFVVDVYNPEGEITTTLTIWADLIGSGD